MSVYSISGASKRAFKRLKTVQAVSEIRTLTSSLNQVRENVDSYHSKWFETISKMCNVARTTPSMPRICGHQCHWANIPVFNPYEYFRRTITVPILDHPLSELDKQFSSHKKNCFSRSILGTISIGNRYLATVSSVVMKV